jgi:hypothetical protein
MLEEPLHFHPTLVSRGDGGLEECRPYLHPQVFHGFHSLFRNCAAVANALPCMINMAWFIAINFFYTYLFSLSLAA